MISYTNFNETNKARNSMYISFKPTKISNLWAIFTQVTFSAMKLGSGGELKKYAY